MRAGMIVEIQLVARTCTYVSECQRSVALLVTQPALMLGTVLRVLTSLLITKTPIPPSGSSAERLRGHIRVRGGSHDCHMLDHIAILGPF